MNVKTGRRVGKRLLSVILGLCLIIGMMPAFVMAGEKTSYAVLGDSISTGYGVTEEERFAALLGKEFSLDMTMLARVGDTSEDLCEVVSDDKNADILRNADIITVTVGGNDMMEAFYTFIADGYNEQNNTTTWTPEKVKETLEKADTSDREFLFLMLFMVSVIEDFPDSQPAKDKAAELGENLDLALGKIRELNPDVTVIVSNQYNPYTQAAADADDTYKDLAPTVEAAFQGGIDLLNQELKTAAEKNGCIVADVASVFRTQTTNPCFASFNGNLNPDFHPNAYGHTLIADTLKGYIAPLLTEYALIVTNGLGSGNYKSGTKVEIKAGDAPEGQHFAYWKAGSDAYDSNFENKYSENTFFTMPAADNVQVTAVYEAHSLRHVPEIPATCSSPGQKEYWECTKCGEKYSDDTCATAVTEDDLVIDALDHNWSQWVLDDQDPAKHVRKCTLCGQTERTEHVFGEYVSNNDATCTADGTKTAKCGFCGETDTVTDEGSALGHSYRSDIDNVCGDCGYVRDMEPVKVFDREIRFVELTDGVDGTEWDTAEKVREKLVGIFEKSGYSSENTVVFDAKLYGTLTVNGVVYKTGEDFNPANLEFTVVIPYPQGTDKNTEGFRVLHMFADSSNALGTEAGDTEMPEPVKLETGLQVTLKGLSPIAVAWETEDSTSDSQGTAGTDENGTVDKNEQNITLTAPKTGEETMALLMAAVVLCAVAVSAVSGKRKSEKK